ncbi:hypothetical protein RRG08_040777 [Elysia crispata]|uniref:Uncharacterized protein n=1 Tax=Elysia crispata TaxID=231223 RepID=A0AAE1EF20_9GAST|nr:hypothetical protein RRG08_040777 [Elysia crispata]
MRKRPDNDAFHDERGAERSLETCSSLLNPSSEILVGKQQGVRNQFLLMSVARPRATSQTSLPTSTVPFDAPRAMFDPHHAHHSDHYITPDRSVTSQSSPDTCPKLDNSLLIFITASAFCTESGQGDCYRG